MDFNSYIVHPSSMVESHTMNFKYDILYKEKVLSTLKRNIIHTRLSIDHTGNLESKSIGESVPTNHTEHQDK